MSQLEQAIEDLYVAFDDVRAPQHMTGCPCCTDDAEFQVLVRTPRRELTIDDLNRYARKAISTQGTKADYLYFFPRIVELIVDDLGWIDWEVVFDKIGETNPSTWPDRRRAGLEAFLLALLDRQARPQPDNYAYGMDIADLVCCVGLSGASLAPWLDALFSYPDALTAFYEEEQSALQTGKLRNAFWGNTLHIDIDKLGPNLRNFHQDRHDRHMAAQGEVVAWLNSDEVEAVVYGLK